MKRLSITLLAACLAVPAVAEPLPTSFPAPGTAVASAPPMATDAGGTTGVPHPIDQRIDAMAAENPSTAGQIQAFEAGFELWDRELNRVYQDLLKALDGDEKARDDLRASQRQWLAFRDREFRLIQSLYDRLSGTMHVPFGIYDRLRFVRERALLLQHYRRLTRGE